MKLICLICCLSGLFVLPSANSAEKGPRETPVVKAVSEVMPSVVNIGTERIVSTSFSPWRADPFEGLFRDYFTEQGESRNTSLGSGSIIDSNGLVLTNSHVVHRASKITVTLENGAQYFAKEIASDDVNDLALIKIEGLPESANLKIMKFARPDDLMLGETVVALGNPFGLGHSISQGILSAVKRKAVYEGNIIFSDILQTDAAINPGNSGGPLININAEMIGVNVAIFKEAQGIGFAIPLKRIECVLAKWLIPERFGDVSLGIIPGERMNEKTAMIEFFVEEIIPNSPAFKSGMKSGTQITEFNGKRIDNLLQLSKILYKVGVSDSVSFKTAEGRIYSFKAEKTKFVDGAEMAKVRLGLGLQVLNTQLAKALDYPFEGGLIISDLPAGIENVERGDIIVRIGDIPVNAIEDVSRALQGKRYGDAVPAIFISVVKKHDRYFLVKKVATLKVK